MKINYKQILNYLDKYSINILSEIDHNTVFTKISSVSSADYDDLSFFSNVKYIDDLKKTKSKACLINEEYIKYLPNKCKPIITDKPYFVFALLSNLFFKNDISSNGIISNTVSIADNTTIHKNVQIDPFSCIHQNTEIMDNTIIGSNSKIGPNVILHSNCIIHDNVSISNSIIMDNCEIQSGARIGGSGFGFDEITKQKIYHNGNVIIGNDTTIGSNTTIDRAVFNSTKIGKFSQIDNLVQIAHNVILGDHSIIAAQSGVAGSTNIGDYVKIGGQSGIAGHLNIGNNVTIAGKSGVTKNIDDNKVVAGFPAKDIRIWKKEIIKTSIKK